MSAPYDDRTAKWLVGDRLSSVLHLGNHALANQLADQGHDVVVATDLLAHTEHREVSYVITSGDKLPFVGNVFDVVIASDVRRSQSELADIARVLKAGGLLSTISQTYDDSIPWLRKLRELVGDPTPQVSTVDTFTASGLFELPEISDFGSWEKLDMDALMAFAESTMVGAETGDTMARVRELFLSYGAQTQSLRLRHQTHCLRARVIKENLPVEAEPPDTMLLDFH